MELCCLRQRELRLFRNLIGGVMTPPYKRILAIKNP